MTLGKSLPISKLQFLHEKMGRCVCVCVCFLALLSMNASLSLKRYVASGKSDHLTHSLSLPLP